MREREARGVAKKLPHVVANQNLEFIPHTKRMNFKLLWEHRTQNTAQGAARRARGGAGEAGTREYYECPKPAQRRV